MVYYWAIFQPLAVFKQGLIMQHKNGLEEKKILPNVEITGIYATMCNCFLTFQ